MSGAPGATVLATEPPKPPAAKPVPGWKHLKKLLPYIARSKGQVVVGMVTLAAMGIIGTLQPLAFGVIMDCLSGNAQPLGRLSQMSPRLTHLLIPDYAPSRRTHSLSIASSRSPLSPLKASFPSGRVGF